MGDLLAEYEGYALSHGEKGPFRIRRPDGTEAELVDATAADLVWLLRLPDQKGRELLTVRGDRYHIKTGRKERNGDQDESADLISAVVACALRSQDPGLELAALDWAANSGVTSVMAEAIRDVSTDSTSPEVRDQAGKLLEVWRQNWLTLPRMPKDDLKKFVLDMLGGAIYTSAHMSPSAQQHNLSMVFMPLALGALSVPEAMLPRVPPLASPPAEPKPTAHPPKPEVAQPKPPERVEPDPKTLEDLEFKARWNRAPADAPEKYRQKIAQENTDRETAYQKELAEVRAAHDKACSEWAKVCRGIDKQNKKSIEDHKAEVAQWEVDHADLIQLHKERDDLERQHFITYTSQIGIFWEYLSTAAPRSINGMPMFFSVRTMHIEDWKRAATAYERERQRHEEIDV